MLLSEFVLISYLQSDRIIDIKTKVMSAISIVAIFATLGLITPAIPAAHAQSVTNSATILCGLVLNPTTVSYGG
jgi:hypothetical protein